MKPFKIEDIEKKKPFDVPDGYFEDLPMKIQARIEKKEIQWFQTPVFKMAVSLASIIIIVITFVFIGTNEPAEDFLADVSQEDLLAYVDFMQLDEQDIFSAFEGSMEGVDFSETQIEEIELEDMELDDLLIEYDLSDDFL